MRVLVAEDVRRLADDIAEGLRDQGIAADVAYDGADAAFKLDLTPYDVLILDRDLPRHPRRHHLPHDHRGRPPGHDPHAHRGRRPRRPGQRTRPGRR